MKTPEELNALKNDVESLTNKLKELTDDELSEIFGGTAPELPATNLACGEYAAMGSPMDKYELA